MDRANGVVEFVQQFVGIVERTIQQDVDLRGFQNADAFEPFVQFIDQANLLSQSWFGKSARDLQALRMVADSDIFETSITSRLDHFLDTVCAVTSGNVRMKLSANIGQRH